MRLHEPARPGHDERAAPTAIVIARRIPAGALFPGIVRLAIAQGIKSYRSLSDPPLGAGGYRNGLPGLEHDFEQQPQLRIIAPARLVEMPYLRCRTVIPAITEHHAEGVPAPSQMARDLVGYITDSPVILRDDRVEHVVADLFAVDAQLMETEPAEP